MSRIARVLGGGRPPRPGDSRTGHQPNAAPNMTPNMTLWPVFYDKTGKRFRRLVGTACALALVAAVLAAWLVPAALAPEGTVPTNRDGGLPRELSTSADFQRLPIIGGGEDKVLDRVVKVVRVRESDGAAAPSPAGIFSAGDGVAKGSGSGEILQLVDPFTNVMYRVATDAERRAIGDSDYAIEHFGRPKDRQLMLTFDDGPNAKFTPAILDLLAREQVPATFFVMGRAVAEHPEILERIVRDGHMVGNHSLTHIDFDDESDFRNRQELIAADRIIRAAANYHTRIFRIPGANPETNVLALLQSQQLGYLHINFDVDTLDWRAVPGAHLAVPELDGRGHVVIMHDGGGDRSETLRALELLIAEAKRQGYTFSTVAPLVAAEYLPVKDVEPDVADIALLHSVRALSGMPVVLSVLLWFGLGALLVLSVLSLALAIINQTRQSRQWRIDCPDDCLPVVSVIVAAYNEEKVIRRTLAELRACDYPPSKFEVIVVDDGSTDRTRAVLEECAYEWPQLRAIGQQNSGKSSAINTGINHACAEATVIFTIDADTLIAPDALRMLARHFAPGVYDEPMGAVAGHIKVGNRRNLLTACQSLEYICGICVARTAEQTINAIWIIPGALSAWSREALERIGGFSGDTLAEDADATLTLQRMGYKIVQENRAVAHTEAPESIRAFAKQRKRWTYGSLQVLWKHRGMVLRPRHGMLGMFALPYAMLCQLVPFVFLPLIFAVATISLTGGNWRGIAMSAAFVGIVHMAVAAMAIAIARERLWHLFVVPMYRVIYEPLRVYLLYASAYRLAKGTIVQWDKLERRNSVTAFAERPSNVETAASPGAGAPAPAMS